MKIYNLEGKESKNIEMPAQFEESYHPDLIKRAVLTVQAGKRQKYGATPEAGKGYSAKLSRRRRNYKSGYGHAMARSSRKVMWRRGMQFGYMGANSPETVGGRKAHPPKSSKIWAKKINKKEYNKAIRSALSATLNKKIVEDRGHKLPKIFPLLLESKLESIKKIKDIKDLFKRLGLEDELIRTSVKKVRAGKGKMRGRRYNKKTGPLIIVSEKCELEKSAKNIPWTNIIQVDMLNAELLAPGTNPGRLTIYTEKAIERLRKEKLYMR